MILRPSKIEDFAVRRGVSVEIYLNKSTGEFYADYLEERLAAKTLESVRKKITALVDRAFALEFKPYIIVTVPRKRRLDLEENGFHSGTRSQIPTFGEGTSISFRRCEMADLPRGGKRRKNERLERLHHEDFEAKIARERSHFFSSYDKLRADEREQALRERRASFQDADTVWATDGDRILPYTDDAWRGLIRICEALRETQRRIDELLLSNIAIERLTLAASSTKLLTIGLSST